MSIVIPILLTVGLVVVAVVVVAARGLEARSWRRSLVAYRLHLPSPLEGRAVATWLMSLAALTHAPRGTLLPQPPVALEVRATAAGIEHMLLMPKSMVNAVLASVRAALPGVRLDELPDAAQLRVAGRHTLGVTVRLWGRSRQLAVDRAEAASRALVAGMQPLHDDELVCWQWIVTGAGTSSPVKANVASQDESLLPWWLESQAPADADELRAARLKQRQPLLHVSGRVVVSADSRSRMLSLFGRAWGPIRLLNVPGAQLVRSFLPSFVVVQDFLQRRLPLLWWPVKLNALELAGLIGFPLGDAPLPGTPAGVARQVPPPVELGRTGTVMADSTYPGLTQPLVVARTDRLMHTALLGPTGTGKSTLMVNMALQDAVADDGLAVLDPKADMVADLLARLPEARRDDAIVVNPADTDRPVGFNVLATDGTEPARELAVDHVLHVFREQWAEFWGPRTDAVLRSALLVLVSVPAPDGSTFTVCELPTFLTDTGFRRWVTSRPGVPVSVKDFWDWFEKISSAERAQVVGPVLNKLTALTHRTPLRLLLGQSQGLDLRAVIQERKLLLMPLSRGLVGAETAGLLSSLMVASLWQAALGRVRIPQAKRRPWWLYVDEVSEVVRLPLDLADLMAEARGIGVGLTLAAQHLSQLPTPVRNSLLATVRSQVVFQVEAADARLLERSFGPTLNEQDLRTLPAYEVAMRLCVNGQTSRPMTGKTRPLPEPSNEPGERRLASRQRYGVDRHDVEAGLRRRLQAPASAQRATREFGKRPYGNRRDQSGGRT